MTNPAEREELLNMPYLKCTSCGKVIGHLRRPYLELSQGGMTPTTIFNRLGMTRYCCRQNVTNPARIAPGLLYNNPRQGGKVRIVDEETAELLGQLSLHGETQRPVSISPLAQLTGGMRTGIGPEPADPGSNRLVASLPAPTPTTRPQVISTATLPGMSVARTDQQPADAIEPAEPTEAVITARHLPPDFEARIGASQLRNSMTAGFSIPGVPTSSSRSLTASQLRASTTSEQLTTSASETAPSGDIEHVGLLAQGINVPVIGRVAPATTVSAMAAATYLPRTITIPDPNAPGKTKIIRQFAGI